MREKPSTWGRGEQSDRAIHRKECRGGDSGLGSCSLRMYLRPMVKPPLTEASIRCPHCGTAKQTTMPLESSSWFSEMPRPPRRREAHAGRLLSVLLLRHLPLPSRQGEYASSISDAPVWRVNQRTKPRRAAPGLAVEPLPGVEPPDLHLCRRPARASSSAPQRRTALGVAIVSE